VIKARKEKGFILVIMLSLLLLLAVTAMSLNVKSGMQTKMAANQSDDTQVYFDQLAAIEQSVWKLTGDPSWRVPLPAGENYTYHDRTYIRTVANSAIFSPNDYRDVVTISVRTPTAPTSGNKFLVNKSFRYNIDTPFLIRTPRQVCLDSAGNIFFADSVNHSIWKIDALTSAIIRVAGTGKSGFSGDGGQATQARLNSPHGVWADSLGNVYIADTNNNRIRRVTGGIISTVAGNGTTGTPLVVNGDGGQATAAQINGPRGVSADASGNIYIADTGNHRIRLVTAATGIIITVAGNGTTGTPLGVDGDGGQATAAQINSPRGVSVDASGNIYIADTRNNRIRKVTAETGIITTLAGTGTAGYAGDEGAATAAQINRPTCIAVKSTGEVIISDTNNSRLRQVIMNTIDIVYTVPPMTAGTGLNSPTGAATYYDSTLKKLFLYIADTNNDIILKLDTVANTIVTVAGNGAAGYLSDGVAATSTRINSPQGVSVDASGNIYIADTGNNRIRKVTAATGIISTVAGISGVYSGLYLPLGDGGQAKDAQINGPRGVSVDAYGNIYIADTGNHRIRLVKAATGIISTVAGISGVYIGPYLPLGDGGQATAAQLNSPQGVSVDASGNIYIADTGNHRIRLVTAATGIISTVAGNGTAGYLSDGVAATSTSINSPQGVSVDASGNIYIADTGNHRLRIVNHDTTPIISTLAGTGTIGYNGDSQPAVLAQLNSPGGVALGLTKGGGRIYIGDTGNDRIRMLFLKAEPQVYGP
jgi:sugar lactone lactonase YvrE